MRVAAAETVLLAGLLLLAAFVVWDGYPALGLPESRWLTRLTGLFPGLVSLEALLVVTLLIAGYWTLQTLGHNQLSFWLIAGLVVLPPRGARLGPQPAHVVTNSSVCKPSSLVSAHSFATPRCSSRAWQGVVTLHRVIGLRAFRQRMALQGIAAADRHSVLQYEGLLLAGLLVVGLSLALFAVLVATLLGRYDEFLVGTTWGVAVVGGGAGALLALTLLLWHRSG